MSYCRFSSDDLACDVYVYEDVAGAWTIHIAGNRLVPREPMPPSILMSNDLAGWFDRHRKVMRIVDASDREPINLPHANETFTEASPGGCADRLEYLRSLGYVVPQYAIDALREKQRDMDAEESEAQP